MLIATAVLAAGCASRATTVTNSPVDSLGRAVAAREIPTRDFKELRHRLAANARIRVTTRDGRMKGDFVDVSDRELTVRKGRDDVRLACDTIDEVEILRDSIATGAVIGGLIAALPAWNGCQNKGRNLPCVVGGIGAYSLIGALFDKGTGPPTRTVYFALPTAERCRPRHRGH
jgi:hypothetical protein